MGCSLTGGRSSTICGEEQPADGLVWFVDHRYQAFDVFPLASSVFEELVYLTFGELPLVSMGKLVFLTLGEVQIRASVEVVLLNSLPLFSHASFSWAIYPASPVCHGEAPLPPPGVRHGRPR